MRGAFGITEPYWSELKEDKRLFWKIFTKVLALIAGCFVAKTGIEIADWLVAAFTALLPLLIIESQRSYKKFPPKFRKTIMRVCIFLGSWSFALLGILIFTQIGYALLTTYLASIAPPQIWPFESEINKLLSLLIFVAAGSFAVLKAFRDSGFEQIIYHLPNQGLRLLFVARPFIASNLYLFACFELAVLLSSYMYSSVIAEILKSFIHLFSVRG